MAPHFWFVSQARQVFALQYFPAPQWPSAVHATHAVPPALQTWVVLVQFAQLAPQCASLLQVLQVPASHHLPALQSAVVEQSLHTPLEQPNGQFASVVG